MITNKELRIGNFVTFFNPKNIFITCKNNEDKIDVDIITSVSDDSIVGIFNDGNFNSCSYSNSTNLVNIEPIPITEEWLLSLGFKNRYNEYYNNIRTSQEIEEIFHDREPCGLTPLIFTRNQILRIKNTSKKLLILMYGIP